MTQGDLNAVKTKLKRSQKIFVNRSLNMGRIKAIGFDMDHTLVTYNREAFEALAFTETVKKFIAAGYPPELERLKFDPNFLIRGLLVDMDRGNILKVDGHKYVKLAFHGRMPLPRDERHRLYNSESFKASNLLSVDTFFALSEVQLFAEVVDYMAHNPGKIGKSFREVYQDLRRFIDLSHADGSIKNVVLSDPARYIKRDKHLAPTLRQQIESGKDLFLLTNSSWDYTNALMAYTLDGLSDDFPSWRQYFSAVLVGAGKPGFFTGSQPFYEVLPETGLLKIFNGPFASNSVYHGGNAKLLQKQMGIRGDEILFVGDHIYGDIIRSKDIVNWRTMLVVEELAQELAKLDELKEALERIKQKLEIREVLEEELQLLSSKIKINERQSLKGDPKKAQYLLKEIEKITPKANERKDELRTLNDEIKAMISEREKTVHPIWGELMKVSLERSRFADQVSDYACIYTSSVTNLRFYSPFKQFFSTHDILPHDL